MAHIGRRLAAWFQSRRPTDDRGVTTAEILFWIAGSVLIIGGLLLRFTDIFNGVTDQVESNLLGG